MQYPEVRRAKPRRTDAVGRRRNETPQLAGVRVDLTQPSTFPASRDGCWRNRLPTRTAPCMIKAGASARVQRDRERGKQLPASAPVFASCFSHASEFVFHSRDRQVFSVRLRSRGHGEGEQFILDRRIALLHLDAQFLECLILDLSDSFARHAQLFANFFQGLWIAVL